MKLSVRRFVLSFFITLIILMFVTGIYVVGRESENISPQYESAIEIDRGDILLLAETADNALSFISPETKAAAHWILTVCAALSKLY